jgi:hypothetical protein
MEALPKAAGFYWGKWRIKDEGTVDEDESPGDEWEVMHVVVNCIDEDDPEYLMVMVPGVAKWQSIENFVWGERVWRDASRDCAIGEAPVAQAVNSNNSKESSGVTVREAGE